MCSDIYWNHCTSAEHFVINSNLPMICACMCQHFYVSKEKNHT